jgi:hypothetical protein
MTARIKIAFHFGQIAGYFFFTPASIYLGHLRQKAVKSLQDPILLKVLKTQEVLIRDQYRFRSAPASQYVRSFIANLVT